MSEYIPFSCLFFCNFKEQDIIFFIRYVLIYIQYMNAVPNSISDIEMIPINGRLGPFMFEYKKEQYLYVEFPEGWNLRFHNMIRKNPHKKKHFILDFIQYITENVKNTTLLNKIMNQFNKESFVISLKKRKCQECELMEFNRVKFEKENMKELIKEFGNIEDGYDFIKNYWKEWQPLICQTNMNRSLIINIFHRILKKELKSIEIIILTGDSLLYESKVKEIKKKFENEIMSKISFINTKKIEWKSLIYAYMQCSIYKKNFNKEESEEYILIYYLLQILFICYDKTYRLPDKNIITIYFKNGTYSEIEMDETFYLTHPLLRGLWTKNKITF